MVWSLNKCYLIRCTTEHSKCLSYVKAIQQKLVMRTKFTFFLADASRRHKGSNPFHLDAQSIVGFPFYQCVCSPESISHWFLMSHFWLGKMLQSCSGNSFRNQLNESLFIFVSVFFWPVLFISCYPTGRPAYSWRHNVVMEKWRCHGCNALFQGYGTIPNLQL